MGELRESTQAPLLVLDTCQRLECFGLSIPSSDLVRLAGRRSDAEAFERLVRIAAGLESRILGELEILGQVRQSYKHFHERAGQAHCALDRMFQDALALARDARKRSGIDSNLTSLGSLAAREVMARVPVESPVAVVGSGSLAASVARYLTKRGGHPVRVSSRCPENALSLAMEVGGFGAGLDELIPLLRGVSAIVTATAAPHALVYPHHLAETARPLVIVDLGVPEDCAPAVRELPDLTYLPLTQIEAKAQYNSEDRRQRAHVAARIIHEGAQAWSARRAAAACRATS